MDKAQLELKAAGEYLKKAHEIWPKGKTILQELNLGLEDLLKLIENLKQINSLLDRNDPSNTMERIRQLLLQNRKHGQNADAHFINGLSQLKELTGIEIDFGA
jgi:hypothetical protein